MFINAQGNRSCDKNELRLILERIDNDKDGKISFDEFCYELNSKLEDID